MVASAACCLPTHCTVLYAPARPPVWKLRKIGAVREQIGAAENVGHKKKLDAGAFTHEHEESYCIPTATPQTS